MTYFWDKMTYCQVSLGNLISSEESLCENHCPLAEVWPAEELLLENSCVSQSGNYQIENTVTLCRKPVKDEQQLLEFRQPVQVECHSSVRKHYVQTNFFSCGWDDFFCDFLSCALYKKGLEFNRAVACSISGGTPSWERTQKMPPDKAALLTLHKASTRKWQFLARRTDPRLSIGWEGFVFFFLFGFDTKSFKENIFAHPGGTGHVPVDGVNCVQAHDQRQGFRKRNHLSWPCGLRWKSILEEEWFWRGYLLKFCDGEVRTGMSLGVWGVFLNRLFGFTGFFSHAFARTKIHSPAESKFFCVAESLA